MWLRADRSGDGKPQLWRAETQLRRPQTRQLDRSSGDKPQCTNSGGGGLSKAPPPKNHPPPHTTPRQKKPPHTPPFSGG